MVEKKMVGGEMRPNISSVGADGELQAQSSRSSSRESHKGWGGKMRVFSVGCGGRVEQLRPRGEVGSRGGQGAKA